MNITYLRSWDKLWDISTFHLSLRWFKNNFILFNNKKSLRVFSLSSHKYLAVTKFIKLWLSLNFVIRYKSAYTRQRSFLNAKSISLRNFFNFAEKKTQKGNEIFLRISKQHKWPTAGTKINQLGFPEKIYYLEYKFYILWKSWHSD